MKIRHPFKLIPLLLLVLGLWGSSPQAILSPKTHLVEIRNMKFEPALLSVKKGDSVIFINRDLVIHNVTEEKKHWASPYILPDSSWTYLVNDNLKYYCSLHPVMKGTLKVNTK